MRTVGVEEELLIVDPGDGSPRARATDVLAEAAESATLERELQQQQIEIATSPHRSLHDLATDLGAQRAAAVRAAAEEGLALAALGTSPRYVQPTPSPDRYSRIIERLGLPAREQLTCGAHVHVETASRHEGVAVLDRIRPWLPVLLALTANSPFWQEADSGFASYRHEAWGRFPSAGPTEIFGSVAAYDRAVETLVATDALLDEGMVYFDVRLSAKFPTVEIRVADVCLHGQDAVLLAALARALVSTAAREWRAGTEPDPVRLELLRVAHWSAARWGLDGALLDPRDWRPAPAATVLERLLAHVEPALRETGDLELVRRLLDDVGERGNGARWQRARLAESRDWADLVRGAIEHTAAPVNLG